MVFDHLIILCFSLGLMGYRSNLHPHSRSPCAGYYSHRETINGSWYIQDLCGAMRKFGDSLEFTELLTLVNRKVSMRSVRNCNDRTAIGKKQVPCFASMLTRKLYFRPKKQ